MADRADLPVAGDECDSCRPFWEKQDKPPRKLVSLGRTTDKLKVPIVVCPYCDGEPILKSAAPQPPTFNSAAEGLAWYESLKPKQPENDDQ